MMADAQTCEEVLAENERLRQQIAAFRQEQERLRAEQARLNERLRWLQHLFAHMPLGVVIRDLEGRIIENNPVCQDIMGYTAEEVRGKPFAFYTHPDDPDVEKSLFAELVAGKLDSYQVEKRCLRKDGRNVWVFLRSMLMFDEHGSPSANMVIVEDITDERLSGEYQMRREHELLQSEERLRTILKTMPVMLTAFDERGNVVFWNDECVRVTGFGADEMLYNHEAYALLYPDTHYREQVAEQVISPQEEYRDWEIVLTNKHGEERIVAWSNNSGLHPILGWYTWLIGIDVTRRKQAEEERVLLQTQIIEAQQATLRELSSPLLPIAEYVIALPLIGAIDGDRAQQMTETLLEGVYHYRALWVILDITGVSVMDTEVASRLVEAAIAVRLLGAQVILTGICPVMAQTLVGLGVDLRDIVTRSTLQRGIAYAMGLER